MGGRVKRANGYILDEFVADEEEVGPMTSESEYEGGDSDDSVEERPKRKTPKKAAPKPFKKLVKIARKPAAASAAKRDMTPEPVMPKTPLAAAQKAKALFSDIAADHDELDAIVGAGTDSEVVESDFSDYGAADGVKAGMSDESDFGDDRTSKKPAAVANKLSSAPVKTEASPPSTKRAREAFENDGDSDVEAEVYHHKHEPATDRQGVRSGNLSLHDLRKRFCVRKQGPAVGAKVGSPDPYDDYERGGPYYL